MLFAKKTCKHCGSEYDVEEATCPACKYADEDFEKLGIPKNIFWIDIWKQLVLFAIGLIGLNTIPIIAELFFGSYADSHPTTYIMVVNLIRYSACLIAAVAIIFKDFKKITWQLKRWWPWVIGIGFGVALLASSVIYSNIINLFYTATPNENQTIINSVIGSFPITSIFLLGILGPIVEEFTYRVGLYSFLRRINKYVAYVVTLVIFGLIHFNFFAKGDDMINELLNLPIYMISGFLLTLAYEKFGLSCSVTAHVFNNLYSVTATIILNLLQNYAQ